LATDEIGRDVLSRVIWGARASLLAGLVSVSIALALGMRWGSSRVIRAASSTAYAMRMIDAMLAIPFLIWRLRSLLFSGRT